MEMLCKDLRNLSRKIINYEMKEMISLTNEEIESYEKQNICHICEKEFNTNKKYRKVRDPCHYTGKFRGAAHNNCNLRYKIPKEIPIVFHNGCTYDYYFIIKQLAMEFKGKFDCLEQNTQNTLLFQHQSIKKMIMVK